MDFKFYRKMRTWQLDIHALSKPTDQQQRRAYNRSQKERCLDPRVTETREEMKVAYQAFLKDRKSDGLKEEYL